MWSHAQGVDTGLNSRSEVNVLKPIVRRHRLDFDYYLHIFTHKHLIKPLAVFTKCICDAGFKTNMEHKVTYFWPLLFSQPPQGQQIRCHCHHQRAPSLRQGERQTDNRKQHHYDKATQTYWRSTRHTVSPCFCCFRCNMC